ncbi:MAG: hypothetical protein LQ339_002104 [Xanthoria mediterranea]|nr:MAG: hypothetical protein LQ339_002104 [Xanthoria mediterranea]
MDQAKAQELIAQLERHHQEQIQSLQALFGLASKDAAQQNLTVVGTAEERQWNKVKGYRCSLGRSGSARKWTPWFLTRTEIPYA